MNIENMRPIVSLETGDIRAYCMKEKAQLDELNEKQIKCKMIHNFDYNQYNAMGILAELLEEIQNDQDYKRLKIVFELEEPRTEQERIIFQDTVKLIREQGYELSVSIYKIRTPDIIKLREVSPSYIKISRELAEMLLEEQRLCSYLKTIVLFGKEMKFALIVDGIDTEELLYMVMRIGIEYGAGNFFTVDSERQENIAPNKVKQILDIQKRIQKKAQRQSNLRTVGDISSKGFTMLPSEKVTVAYDLFERQLECSDISIVDEKQKFVGLLTKTDLLHAFGGKYGYSLHERNRVVELAKTDTMIVYKNFSIENVAMLAMERETNELYDPIVVLDGGSYYGIVTIKDLLSATVTIEVEKANEANPLTSLPGNRLIEQRINQLMGERDFYAIIYLDLDNFKAFNDAYGFPNGDRMIEILSKTMQKSYGEDAFYGHVGGDDFVVITREADVEERSNLLIEKFKKHIREIYNDTDWENGYIRAENRKGVVEQFPIASVSIAIITNRYNYYERMMELTEQIVTAKKKAKQIEGNAVVIL